MPTGPPPAITTRSVSAIPILAVDEGREYPARPAGGQPRRNGHRGEVFPVVLPFIWFQNFRGHKAGNGTGKYNMIRGYRAARGAVVIIAGFALSLLVAGCTTMDTVREAPLTDGPSRGYNASYAEVSGATVKSLSTLNVDVRSSEETSAGLIILVNKRLSAFSWGEVGRVFVEKSTASPTRVFTRWEKRAKFQVTGTSENEFSNEIFDAIASALLKK